MGSIIGGITGALGITTKPSKLGGNGTAQIQQVDKLSAEQIKFMKDQLASWTSIYGDVEKNLGEYYKNLSPDTLIKTGLTNQQKEFQLAQQNITKELAQRGLAGSGMEVQANIVGGFQNAEARARIRTEAPAQIAQQKLGFLELGLNKQSNLIQGINNAYGNTINTYGNIATALNSSAQRQTQSNNERTADFLGTVLGFIP